MEVTFPAERSGLAVRFSREVPRGAAGCTVRWFFVFPDTAARNSFSVFFEGFELVRRRLALVSPSTCNAAKRTHGASSAGCGLGA
jgi:hypothetical protein